MRRRSGVGWLLFVGLAALFAVGAFADEWYRGEWWAGKFVILVDDADAANPSDREGRAQFR